MTRSFRQFEPTKGVLYRATQAFEFRERADEQYNIIFIEKGTVFMLVDNPERSLGRHGGHVTRCLWDGRNWSSSLCLGSLTHTVYVFHILHNEKVYEVGFRDPDWGTLLRPYHPKRGCTSRGRDEASA